MKLILSALATALVLQSLGAQTSGKGIEGVWQGAMIFGEGKVRVIFYVAPPRDGAYSGAMVNLESGIASNVDLITFSDGKVRLEMNALKVEGTVSPSWNEIKAKFAQGETSGDLTLTRGSENAEKVANDYEKQEYMIPM